MNKEVEIIKGIIKNYDQEEKSIVDQLKFMHNHGTTIGGYREDIWRGMFENIVPKKFSIEQSVFLIDSGGRVSKEVDLAIFDEMYTPYIFKKGRIKFIPIEAVAVAVQCKSKSLNNNELKDWSESIKSLKTSRKAITRQFSTISTDELKYNFKGEEIPLTQTATRPILILCCLCNPSEEAKDLFDILIYNVIKEDKSENNDKSDKIKEIENIIEDDKKLHIMIKEGDLVSWFIKLNHNEGREKVQDKFKNMGSDINADNNKLLNAYRIFEGENEISLMSLNFQLNQLLMLINNPMMFPHIAYVKMFNELYKEKYLMEQILSKKLQVISPMFSYGAPKILEARPTELKGLMRYIYRIASVEKDVRALYYRESELFGGTVEKEAKKASPIRINMQIINSDSKNNKLVMHKGFTAESFDCKTIFEVKFFYHDIISENRFDYKNLFYLSLILGGIGKRSRRGRGCMTVDEISSMSKDEQLRFVAKQLNAICNCGYDIYRISGDEIINNKYDVVKNYNRPIIHKIMIGKKIDDTDEFYIKLDNACHEIHDNKNSYIKYGVQYNKYATGYAYKSEKFASSVMVSITKTREGLYPVYTFVTPVLGDGKKLDSSGQERKAFFKKIEGREINV